MRISQRRAEQAAGDVLERFHVREPPVPLEEIAVGLDAQVQRRPNGPDVSGLLYRDHEHTVIGINEDDSPSRQRFTLAHELGHLVLHEGQQLWVDRSVRVNLRSTGESGRGGQEREANWFAAELLMPEAMVRRAAAQVAERRQLSDESMIQALAETFDVSRAAMGYRLFNLGIIRNL